jgi:heavy metal translocating P-type ATPase
MTTRGSWAASFTRQVLTTRDALIAALSLAALAGHLLLHYVFAVPAVVAITPLVAALAVGGLPLLVTLARQLLKGQFGSDLLAGLAIVTAAWLGEYLIAVVVVLMLSGGQALEQYATRRASAVLDALARRNPAVAHRSVGKAVVDVGLDDVAVGDVLIVLPHEICPVDGVVRDGASTMDESYISGEPFLVRKTTGVSVMSGAINGDGALTIVAQRRAVDSRYQRIVRIVKAAEENRPRMRRLADRLGAWYTPVAVSVASAGWLASGDPSRFLAVIVIATPCPLLLAIPITIIGAISLAATRSIVIKDAGLLERIGSCRTVIFDKTGTLTLGRPELTDVACAPGFDRQQVLQLAASLEQYSKHPLAPAVIRAAGLDAGRLVVTEASERAGDGLTGRVAGRMVRITSRLHVEPEQQRRLPDQSGGLECVVLVDCVAAAVFRFRDVPRRESQPFVGHLGPRHGVNRTLLVSGDRESEVRYLAEVVGIANARFSQSPEEKVKIVTEETRRQPTLFVGDGLNDAPAMLAASVGVALGQGNEIIAEAAGAVILDGSLSRVDELLHIAARTRRIALQSAAGGMLLSMGGMALAALGWLPALSGAVAQEAIDVLAVLNALRAALPPPDLTDF